MEDNRSILEGFRISPFRMALCALALIGMIGGGIILIKENEWIILLGNLIVYYFSFPKLKEVWRRMVY